MLTKLTIKLYKYTDTAAWAKLCHTKLGIFLVSVMLGALGTLGFAPYHFWIVTLTVLAFQFFFVSTLKSLKAVFCSLLLFFTAMNTLTLEWLNYVMTGFGGLPAIVSYSIETLFSAYLALFHAILGTFAFRLAMRRIKKSPASTASATTNTAPTDAASNTERAAVSKDTTLGDTQKVVASQATSSANVSSKSKVDDDYDEDDDEYAVEMAPRGLSTSSYDSAQSGDNVQSSANQTQSYSTSASEDENLNCLDDTADVAQARSSALNQAQSQQTDGRSAVVLKRAPLGGHASGMASGSDRLYPVLTLKDGIERRLFKNAFLLGFLPAALVIADYIIGVLFTGFPWMYVGYTTVTGPFTAFAPLVGVRGISLLLFICAGAIALSIERRYIYLPVAGVIFFIGVITMGAKYVSPMDPIKVAGIQGNIEQSIKWKPEQTIPSIDKYMHLTTPEIGKNDLIVWPESAMPVYVQQIFPMLDDLNFFSHEQQTAILLGIQRITPAKKSYNSMFVLGQNEDFHYAQTYDKRQLVPFGEIVPFADYTRQLGSIFNFPMSSFTRGDYNQEQIRINKGNLKFIPALCYESIFPELMLSMHNDETNGIIMISNDSWYGNTRGPIEHLSIARMRSMEMQKPMIRVTNSGITAHINELGEIVERLPSDKEGVLHMTYTPTEGSTPYARFGISIFIVLVLLSIFAGFMLRRVHQDAGRQQFEDMIRP